MTSPRDKRLFPRRPTSPVPVLLSHETDADIPGTVLDYSPAGLTIQANLPVPADAIVRVQCVRGGADSVEVRVVHCSAQEGSWQLGCRFEPTRHWDDLWMFGE
jgi:PilZ domain